MLLLLHSSATRLNNPWIFGYQTQIVYFPDSKIAAALQVNSDPNGSFKVPPGECLGKIVSLVMHDLKAAAPGGDP